MRTLLLVLSLPVVVVSLDVLPAQLPPGPIWRQQPPIGSFVAQATYVDEAGALVAVGGLSPALRVWRLHGDWQELSPTPAPPHHPGAAYAYDHDRGVLVMFGGAATGTSTLLDQFWEFDGNAWTEPAPNQRPPARSGAALAYDPVRQRLVLFGGTAFPTLLSDTWEYDGADWTQVATGTQPQLLDRSRMVFDEGLQQLLLVGTPTSGTDCETWRYDGVDWTRIVTSVSPSERVDFRMAYDPMRMRTVLHGGLGPGSFGGPSIDETWLFDGSDWTSQVGASMPGFLGHDLVHWPAVAGVVCVGGGNGTTSPSGAVYVSTPSGWLPITPEVPFVRLRPRIAFDSARQAIVLHRGSDANGYAYRSTFEWRAATGWRQTHVGASPDAEIAYDPVRDRIVSVDAGMTWEYRDGDWSALPLPSTPPNGPICFDRHRQQIVLVSAATAWSYDGQQWHPSALSGTGAPSPSSPASFQRAAHSSADGAVIVNTSNSGPLHVLTGSSWPPSVAPPTTNLYRIAEDPLRGGIVGLGLGSGATVFLRRASQPPQWQVHPLREHEEIWNCTLVSDVVRGQVYAVGPSGTVWQLDWIDSPAATAFGNGCAGSNGVPSLRLASPSPSPGLGQTMQLLLSGLPLAGGVGALALGESIATLGASLPVALDPVGLPGCRAWISFADALVFAHQGAGALRDVPLPSAPGLAGVTFGLQAIVLDPGANNAWGSVSNAFLVTPY